MVYCTQGLLMGMNDTMNKALVIEDIISEYEKWWLENTICGGFSRLIMSHSTAPYSYDIIVDGIVEFETSSEYRFPMKFKLSSKNTKMHLEVPVTKEMLLSDLDTKCLQIVRNLKKDVTQRHPDIKSMKF